MATIVSQPSRVPNVPTSFVIADWARFVAVQSFLGHRSELLIVARLALSSCRLSVDDVGVDAIVLGAPNALAVRQLGPLVESASGLDRSVVARVALRRLSPAASSVNGGVRSAELVGIDHIRLGLTVRGIALLGPVPECDMIEFGHVGHLAHRLDAELFGHYG